MSMSLAQIVKEVEAAQVAWKLILDPKKRFEGGRDGTRLLLEPPLVEHFGILMHVSFVALHVACKLGVDQAHITDRFGFGKVVEWGIEYTLSPKQREHCWLSMAGLIAAYDPARDPYLRAALGATWKQSLYEHLPAAVRLAFNESGPGEKIAPDRSGKRSITSRTKRQLRKTGDEAAEKPKRVTSKRLESEETE